MLNRVIPVLLLEENSLVKTVQFSTPKYVGDPINATRIFNKKEVDELIVLDIGAWKKEINFYLIESIAEECFMPLAYGGGIRTIEDVLTLNRCGVEKFVFGESGYNYDFIEKVGKTVGCQSIVIALDAKLFNDYVLYINNGKVKCDISLEEHVKILSDIGVGEFMVTAIHKEGTWEGYDLDLLEKVKSFTDVPIIIHGGAGNISDLFKGLEAGASAVAIGSMAVYQGKGKGVLIRFPDLAILEQLREGLNESMQ